MAAVPLWPSKMVDLVLAIKATSALKAGFGLFGGCWDLSGIDNFNFVSSTLLPCQLKVGIGILSERVCENFVTGGLVGSATS